MGRGRRKKIGRSRFFCALFRGTRPFFDQIRILGRAAGQLDVLFLGWRIFTNRMFLARAKKNQRDGRKEDAEVAKGKWHNAPQGNRAFVSCARSKTRLLILIIILILIANAVKPV